MKLMLNGREVQMDNFGADPAKEGFNRFGIIAPTWNELARPIQQRVNSLAKLNGLTIDAAGYEHALTVLTQIKSQVIKQKFYEVEPSGFMPVVVGEGAWLNNLVFNHVYLNADDFESGIVDSSMPMNKKSEVDVEIIAKPIPIVSWNKSFKYSIIQIEQAAKGNVDIVTKLEEARKKSWDLGIQRIAFLGSKSKSTIKGLYNGESVTANTTFIAEPISEMSSAEFQLLVAGMLKLYAANVNSTTLPNRLVLPQADFLGMAAAASSDYPVVDKLTYLENAFKRICGGDFKILQTAYGNKAQMATAGVNAYRYMLYRDDAEALELNIPVAYTTTSFGTPNGFDFENVAMGQFSGVYFKRPQEAMYFDDVVTA